MSKRSDELTAKIARSLNDLTAALASGEPIAEKFTCRRVVLDLVPIPYSPQAVKDTRKILRVSQSVFAMFLGVKPSTVQKWEQGRQPVNVMASRFMDEIRRDPDHWRERLRQCMRVKEAGKC
jgi:putative transcriptional regulator